MRETIKQTWIVFTISALVASLLSFIPLQKMQSKYMSEFHRLKAAPQKRIDDTFKYIEAMEDGILQPQTSETSPKISHDKNYTQKPYQKPLYVRDKNNPRILHAYNEK